jgi:exopolysaccharide biosynthesis polyprenyl glycosylphosphotransferase
MSTSHAVEQPPDPPAVIAAGEPDLSKSLDEAPRWPVTRMVAWSLTLILFLCLLGPAALTEKHSGDWLLLLLPSMLAALGARVLFEALGWAAGSRQLRHHLAAAAPAAATSVALLFAVSAILGVAWSPAAAGGMVLLSAATLTTAGIARDVEVRVRLSLRRVYFVGAQAARRELESELRRRHDARLVGATDIAMPIDRDRLVAHAVQTRATVLVLDGDAMRIPALVDAASQLNLNGVHVRDLVSYYEAEFKKVPLSELSPTWFLFDIAPIHRRGLSRVLRRACEVAAAGAILLIAIPVLALAALAIKLTSPGPVLYRQRRVGKSGAVFTLLKLRTMTEAGEADAVWASSAAHRITRVGRILRRFRLDELPQLWNVIRGDLALVGPRPEQVPIAERLERELPHYSARHCIRPGITGWAQVNLGYAGSIEGTTAKLQRDLYYVKHSSLRLDLLILWLTFRAVIAGRG